MTQYHRLYVPHALWQEIIFAVEGIPGKKPTDHALDLLRGAADPFKNPPKTRSAPVEEKKMTGSPGPRFLCHDLKTGLTNWVQKTDNNKDLYLTFFYFCEKKNMLTGDTYGPLFRKDSDWSMTQDLKELAKLLAQDREAYLEKLNEPREHVAHDNSEADEVMDQRRKELNGEQQES